MRFEISVSAPVTEISMTVPFVTLSSSLRRLTSKSVREVSTFPRTFSIMWSNRRTSKAGIRIRRADFIYTHRATRENRQHESMSEVFVTAKGQGSVSRIRRCHGANSKMSAGSDHLGVRNLASQPPRVPTMEAKSQRPKGRESTISALNALIEALNLAKELSSITPAKAVFGSVSVILSAIRASSPLISSMLTKCRPKCT